ncbi:MAG: nucleotide exchange factor GrpE [Planctomycetaceae bacterium]|nr:nucleotide exchange factor GrpE [Planctomycetaceae bacterium]
MNTENEPQPTSSDTQPQASAIEQAADAVAEAAVTEQTVDAAQLQAKINDLNDRLLRNQAELENFRRRTYREAEDARKFESLRLIRDLLPGIDNLERAVTSAEQTGDLQNLLQGIKMVLQQFRDILRTHNAEPIEAQGKPFDPNLHEALTQVPSADVDPMTVMQVVETGFRMHDRVVRPARVIVSCAPPE